MVGLHSSAVSMSQTFFTSVYTINMSEGCSACSCGVSGACDQLYLPGFLWPGVVALVIGLMVLVFFSRKKVIKIQLKKLVIGWIIVAILFVGVVAINTESAGDRASRSAKYCLDSGDPSCEY